MGENVKVLLVGEAEPEGGSLRAQLDSLGFALQFVPAGEEALAAVDAAHPDLVIIDTTAADVDACALAWRNAEAKAWSTSWSARRSA